MYVAAGTVTLTNDTLSGNNAKGGVGGVGGVGGNAPSGFGGNGGSGGEGGAGSGGGMDVAAGTVTLLNDTLSSNQVNGGSGGSGRAGGHGVANANSGANGTGGSGGNAMGGGLYLVSGSATLLTNTLIAQDTVTAGSAGQGGSGSTSGSASGPDVSGNLASNFHDLIENGTGSNLTNGTNGDQVGPFSFTGDLTQGSLATIKNVSSMTGLAVGQPVTDTAGALPAGTVITGLGTDTIMLSQAATKPQTGDGFTSSLDPDLGPLKNNGGPLAGAPGSQQVVQTMALLFMNGAPSPAIDTGNSNAAGLPSTDERGATRIRGAAVDIGAYEMQPAILSSAILADGSVGTTYIHTLPAPTQAGYQNSWGSFTYTPTDAMKLPPGLSLASDGTLSGVPTTAGPFTFTVVASDFAGFGTQTYTVVVKDPTSISVSASNAAPVYGQTVTLTATVTAVAGGAIPTASDGTVTFYDGTKMLGTATLSGSPATATLTTATLAAGQHSITASYSGDSKFDAALFGQCAVPAVGLNFPESVAVDSAGNVYIADTGNNQVVELPNNGAQVDVGVYYQLPLFTPISFFRPFAVAAVGPGQALATDGTGVLVQLGNPPTPVGFGIVTPPGQATDSQGDVFIADPAHNLVLEHKTDGSVTPVGSGLNQPIGVAVDSAGDVFIADSGNNRVVEVKSGLLVAVSKISTSSLLRSAPGASVFGQAVAFLAVVTPVTAGTGTPTGTVDFKDGSTDLTPGGVTLAGGRATFTTAALSMGSHTITASYSGDSKFQVSSGSSTQMVSQAATSTALTSSATVSGQQIVFRATVRTVAPGTGTPTGTVDFKDGATDLTPGGVKLSAGEATFSTTTLAVGSHTITALYSGDADYTTSQANDAPAPQVVNKDASHTVLTSFPDPAVFGQVVTFTVIVRSVPLGSGTPTGTVTFLDGTKTLGSMTLDSTARATFSTASLSRGNHAISVNYSGDGKFLASADTNFGETVLQDATTTTVTPSANSGVIGSTITFTASVVANAQGAGTPTGTVTFKDISTVLGTATLNSAGKATFTTSTLVVGTHAISASYAGDTNFLSSFSSSMSEVVTASVRAALGSPSPRTGTQAPGASATTTSVSSTPNPSVLGQAVTFTATISAVMPGLPTPSLGTVDFKEGNTDLTPGGVPVVGGQAIFATSALAVGSHTITAIYSGDILFMASQGDDSASPQVINKDGTSGLIISVPGASVFGQPAAFFAFVTAADPAAGTPTGTVTFKDGTTVLGASATLSGGSATFTTAALSVGSHTITAVYSGDSNFTGSQADDSASPLVVSKDGTTTALTSSQKTTVSGENVVFRATVRAVAPGTRIPAGTVDFKDGATDLTPGGVTLSAGEATFSTTALAVGSHTITAIYSGGPRYTTSQVNDAAAPQVVSKDASHTVLTSFPNPAVFGQVVTFTVIVRSVPLGSGTPTGMVTFLDGTKTLGSMTLDGTARATFSTASLSRGNHAISVNYSGDGNFLASADTNFGETVQKDTTTATVTASANPAVAGTTITFTATLQASSPGAGTPSGTVTFLDLTTTLGIGTLNAAGKATFTTSALALGTHAISASYAGDNNFLASASPTLTETIKSSAAASSALAFSATRPIDPVLGTAKSTLATPSAEAQGVRRATLAQGSAAEPTAATWDPSQLDRYFAAVTTRSAARLLAQRAAQKHDPADWVDDPFLFTN
jgi:hypothetical protein